MPEVRAARRALEAHCVGRRIACSAVADDPKAFVAGAGVICVAFERAMVGRTIVAACRWGKNLWLRLDAPPFPSFQLDHPEPIARRRRPWEGKGRIPCTKRNPTMTPFSPCHHVDASKYMGPGLDFCFPHRTVG